MDSPVSGENNHSYLSTENQHFFLSSESTKIAIAALDPTLD